MLLKRIGIVLAALIPVAIVGAFVFSPEEQNTETTATTTPTTTSTIPAGGTATTTTPATPTDTGATGTSQQAFTYKDGTYTADGAYVSPMGDEKITVTMTVTSDVVTAVSMVSHGTGASAMWQGKFSAGLSAAVVGKSLEDLKLTKVSGSSLTPIGFNDAVEAIQGQAEV